MRASALIAAVTTAAILAGCGLVTPSLQDLHTADWGPAPTHEIELATVRAQVGPKLKDPYSAVYECAPARHGWTNTMGHLQYGWLVGCSVNGKNSFGGYTGAEEHHFLMRGSDILVNGETTIAAFNLAGDR